VHPPELECQANLSSLQASHPTVTRIIHTSIRLMDCTKQDEQREMQYSTVQLCSTCSTYDDHLRLVGKRVGDFLLVLNELFSLGRTAEALRAVICSKSAISLQRGSVDPKFQAEGVAHTNIMHQKCIRNALQYTVSKPQHDTTLTTAPPAMIRMRIYLLNYLLYNV